MMMESYQYYEIYKFLESLETAGMILKSRFQLQENSLGILNVKNEIILQSSNQTGHERTKSPYTTLELIEVSRKMNDIHVVKALKIVKTTYGYVSETGVGDITDMTRTHIPIQLFLYHYLDVYKEHITDDIGHSILKILKNTKINSGRFDKNRITENYFSNIRDIVDKEGGQISIGSLKQALKMTCIKEEFLYSIITYFIDKDQAGNPEKLTELIRYLIGFGISKYVYYNSLNNGDK